MPNVFSITRRIQFADTDMAGIVHFANYFRMMEEVEHAFFRSLGLSISMLFDGTHVTWPRVAATCEFFLPIRFEDEVELRLTVTKVGDKSFNYDVEFYLDGARRAAGKLTSVCCVIESGKMRSITIPPLLREKLMA